MERQPSWRWIIWVGMRESEDGGRFWVLACVTAGCWRPSPSRPAGEDGMVVVACPSPCAVLSMFMNRLPPSSVACDRGLTDEREG